MRDYLTIIHQGGMVLGLCKKLTLLLYPVQQLYHYINQTSLKNKSLVVTCWERADLLALVCAVFFELVTFPLVSLVMCGT